MTTPHTTTAEAILAETGPLGFDHDDTPEPVEAEEAPGQDIPPLADEPESPESPESTEDAPKKGLSWAEAMKRVASSDPEAAELMKNMQADYTRKTQQAAQERKDALRERKALLAGREKIEAKEKEPLPEYDPWNESSIQARIQREVEAKLAALLEPMQQEVQVMQAEEAYSTFVTEHPEFTEDASLRSEVQTLLEANVNLDLETAYWAAKGRRAKQEAADRAAKEKAQRAARRQAASAVGAPRRGGSGRTSKQDLKGMGNADLLALARQMAEK